MSRKLHNIWIQIQQISILISIFWNLRPCTRRAPQFFLERQEIEREGRVGEGVIQTGQSTVSRCRLRFFFLLRFEGAASMMSGDKTASVMTSWTTKVLNSRRRRRQFLEFRSSASAARRPTPAAPRNVTPVLVMLQKFTAILRNGRILLPRRIIFEPPWCIHLFTVCFSKHIEIRSFETEVCILVFVLPGMERGKGEVTPGHWESVESSGSENVRENVRKPCQMAQAKNINTC